MSREFIRETNDISTVPTVSWSTMVSTPGQQRKDDCYRLVTSMIITPKGSKSPLHVYCREIHPMEPRFLPKESAMGHSDNMESKTKVSLSLGILCRRAMENPLVPRSTQLEINVTRVGEKVEEQVGK